MIPHAARSPLPATLFLDPRGECSPSYDAKYVIKGIVVIFFLSGVVAAVDPVFGAIPC
jgi:hypothetical protein